MITLGIELEPKLLELLQAVMPTATTIGALINRANPNAEAQSRELQAAARKLGQLKLHILNASSENDFDKAFAALARQQAGAVLITGDALLPRSKGAVTHENPTPRIKLAPQRV